ncbi:MAG: ABC transporter substrate-binding protein [Anaerolineaceae bacterium]|nr:ABC transporter substrate-binding protein [Anaerolineaceae bacterium]
MLKARFTFVLMLIALVAALAFSPALAQDDVPVITIYNNSGTLQFDSGGSNPDVLEEVTQYIVDAVGVRPEVIVPPGGSATEEKLNLLLGSSDPLDLFQAGRWTDYREAIIPLNDLLDEYGDNLLSVIPEAQWGKCTDTEGNIMCIPRSTPTSPYIMWVRQDWLNELGLEVPTTVEEFEATIAAFQEAKPDSFIATRPGDYHWASVGGWTEYGYSNWVDEDGTMKPWILQPGVVDWVAKMNEWWNNGWFYADTFTSFEEPELFRTCNIGAWMGWYSRVTLITPQVESACEGIEWVRTSITGPEGYLATVRPQNTSGYVVTRKSQHPEAVIQFMNWVYDDEGVENQLVARYGIPERDWWFVDEENNVVDRDPDSGFVSEFMMPNLNIEVRYSVMDPARAWHLEYLAGELQYLDDAKMPVDAPYAFDETRIADEVPGLGDINRLMDEQLILFVTGARPLDQWDSFLEDLNRAGMQDYIDALTTQYNEFTGM